MAAKGKFSQRSATEIPDRPMASEPYILAYPPSAPSAADIAAQESQLAQHPIYTAVRDLAGLRAFVERHVICVLDFMSLLKSIEHDLIPRRRAWAPVTDAAAARFLHEIVLDEETEELPDGRVLSHFEWYLQAMDELGADSGPARELATAFAQGEEPQAALAASALPPESKAFGRVTFEFLEAPVHVRAAVFFHGRENVIPRMFLPLAEHLRASGVPCDTLVAYLERHVEVDGEDHGPRAEALLKRLYGDRTDAEAEALQGAAHSLAARGALWDATLGAVTQ